jgi:SAM-dependent methyltransferase
VSSRSRQPADKWTDGSAYESYIGRWSRPVARGFIGWLDLPPKQRWLDVGCGTGALLQTIISLADPGAINGIDPAPEYLALARKNVTDPRAEFSVGAAQATPEPTSSFDAAVSGLVLNFVPEPVDAVREMARVVRPGGCVAVYVWDYAGKMELMRYFWDAAVAIDPEADTLDEGRRFSVCDRDALAACFASAGLREIEMRAIDVPTVFRDFDDYWSPFLGRQGSAPGYVASLPSERQEQLSALLRKMMPFQSDGSIHLVARAWAVRGVR